MALHFENGRQTVADIDHAGVFAGPANNPRCFGRQRPEPFLGRFIRAVLAPHHREDAQFGEVRHSTENLHRAGEFVRRQAMLGGQFDGDVGQVLHGLGERVENGIK